MLGYTNILLSKEKKGYKIRGKPNPSSKIESNLEGTHWEGSCAK
jgi:hypothetical protein